MIDVSCIIINFNTSQLTKEAIQSVIDLTGTSLSYEIVVVDNASQFPDYLKLKEFVDQSPDFVSIYRSRINTGFGGGNMLGVQFAKPSKYYAFINNDILLVQKNTLLDLFSFMENDSSIGICSPQMLDENKKFRGTIDHFATPSRQLLKRGFLEKINPTKYPNRKKTYSEPVRANYVQGSFMFTRAASFNKVGGFDTNLFLYYEESDLSMRILKRFNQSSYLYPQQSYIHYKGGSTEKSIFIKIEQKISLLYLIHKHHGLIAHRFLLGFYILKYFFSSLLKPKNWKLFTTLLKGAPLSLSLKHKQIVLPE
jgi:GT2 family glycosyltransferase